MSDHKLPYRNLATFDFKHLKNVIQRDALRKRALKEKEHFVPRIPPEIALQITYRCNLRCRSCMQWSKIGFLRNCCSSNYLDLNPEIISRVLFETKEARSILHLWGGEPLIHREWEQVSAEFAKEKRDIVLNTNGVLIEEKLDSLLRLGSKLIFVISLDGNKKSNDYIRGTGTYEKVIRTIKNLTKIRERHLFKGKIIVNTVINESLIPHLSGFVDTINKLSPDQLILNYPWFISDIGCIIMDGYFRENFQWLNTTNKNSQHSWHSFRFSIPDQSIPILSSQIKSIFQKKLKLKIRIQPNIRPEEILDLRGCNYRMGIHKQSWCLATYNRICVCADGNVSACPDFPEFVMGNLFNENLTGIWNGENYNKTREIRANGFWPLPVCFKCSLYSLNRI